jgi:tetratricopeptide (TPR) repeat protein
MMTNPGRIPGHALARISKSTLALGFSIFITLAIVSAACAQAKGDEIRRLMIEAKRQQQYLEYGKAIDIYTQLIKLAPNQASFFAKRGSLREKLSLWQLAIDDYTKAIKLEPDADVYRDRGGCYWKFHKPKEALCDYNEALRLEPGHTGAYVKRARILRNLGRFRDAIADCKTALASGPDDQDKHQIYLDMGECQMKLGCYQDAVKSYTGMIAAFPDLSGGYYGRAAAYERLGKVDLARKDKEKGLKADADYDPNVVTGKMRR